MSMLFVSFIKPLCSSITAFQPFEDSLKEAMRLGDRPVEAIAGGPIPETPDNSDQQLSGRFEPGQVPDVLWLNLLHNLPCRSFTRCSCVRIAGELVKEIGPGLFPEASSKRASTMKPR